MICWRQKTKPIRPRLNSTVSAIVLLIKPKLYGTRVNYTLIFEITYALTLALVKHLKKSFMHNKLKSLWTIYSYYRFHFKMEKSTKKELGSNRK